MKSEEFATARIIMKYELRIMNYKNLIAVLLVSVVLSGCGLYKKYESKATVPGDVFGTTQDVITK